MKNLVLSVVVTAFLFTAAPAHAQVSIPTDREGLIALIQVLLKRIEEIKSQSNGVNEAQNTRDEKNQTRKEREKHDLEIEYASLDMTLAARRKDGNRTA